jgi:hypothetical protein
MGGLRLVSYVFSMNSHRLAPDQRFWGSFEGVLPIAISLFSWEFAFLTSRCPPPVFGKDNLRLEILLFLHILTLVRAHSDAFLPRILSVSLWAHAPKAPPFNHRRHGSRAFFGREPCLE